MANHDPRGIEILLKKAAVDPAFQEILLRDPMEAAGQIGLELDPMEAGMLRAIPKEQLSATIRRTEVPQSQRRAFLGTAAATMLAVLGGASDALAGMPQKINKPLGGAGGGAGGILSDMPPERNSMGIRPDAPPPRPPTLEERVRQFLARELGVRPEQLTPNTRILFDERKWLEFRKKIRREFDVRMPIKTFNSLRTVKLLSDYIIQSHEGYDEVDVPPESGDGKPSEL